MFIPAYRMATDLNLHRKTTTLGDDTPEGRAREKEVHNRERTWLLCYALDRSMSLQMGKPHSIKEEYVVAPVQNVEFLFSRRVSFIIQNTELFRNKPIAGKGDAGICVYVVRGHQHPFSICANITAIDRNSNAYCPEVLISCTQVRHRPRV